MRRTNRFRLPAALVLLVALGACTDGNDGGASPPERSTAESAQDPSGASVGEPGEEATSTDATSTDATSTDATSRGGLVPSSLAAVDHGRDIVFTARLEMEVDDVERATLEAVTAIGSLGGLVFGQETTTRPSPVTTLVFKVPPESFQAALAGLGDVGFVRSRQISADDVTERVVDLESRIISAAASVDRLRGFLGESTDLTSIAQLEAELLRRETDLELLRGQLRTVQDQVSLATIAVTITEAVPAPGIALDATFVAGRIDDGPTPCPGADELEVVEGDSVIVCLSVTNSGDTHLADLVISDPAFDVEHRDLVLVSGDPEVLDGTRPLAPGEQLLVAAQTEAADSRASLGRVRATPVDSEGQGLGGQSLGGQGLGGQGLGAASVTDAADAWLTVEPDDSLPGFVAGLGAGWAVVQRAIGVVVVGLGFLLPFIWVVPALWLLRRNLRRRPTGSASPGSAGVDGTTMTPPPATITPGD